MEEGSEKNEKVNGLGGMLGNAAIASISSEPGLLFA